jgi:cytochrome d ubiquinol oxidase subunit I
MEFDPVFLPRLQFARVIGWHILLPAFTVGAAAFIAVLEGFNLVTEAHRKWQERRSRAFFT